MSYFKTSKFRSEKACYDKMSKQKQKITPTF